METVLKNKLDAALFLAKKGFHIFPLAPGSKIPVYKDFENLSTRNETQIRSWFRTNDFNIGIFTGKFKDNEALVALDVDVKDGKQGNESLKHLVESGIEIPRTFTQLTSTGGSHLIFRSPTPVKQGANILGNGLDVRSRGGYLVGAGSRIGDKLYTCEDGPIELCPSEIIDRLTIERTVDKPQESAQNKADQNYALERGKIYLERFAPIAVEGQGGDQTTFMVASKLRSFGISFANACELMSSIYNSKCIPAWTESELEAKVSNAYKYAVEPVGAKAPENQFEPIPEVPFDNDALDYIKDFNKRFALVTIGAKLRVVKTSGDEFTFWEENTFHKITAAEVTTRTVTQADGTDKVFKTPISKLWIVSKYRRTYEGVCFVPGKPGPKNKLNLWQGFTVRELGEFETLPPIAKEGFEMYLAHIKENICAGDEALYGWLITWAAHLIQKPWEKAKVATVFKGRKGVGKNVFIETIGNLMQKNFLLASSKRQIVGQFNGALEGKLLLVLDEAFWGGDKESESALKDLITGSKINVERKGYEIYQVDNFARVAIIGNEDWLAPASADERRFAVFEVGESKMQNVKHFQKMLSGLSKGGDILLFNYLKEWDLTKYDVNQAPQTKGLLAQKEMSLTPLQQWWLDCLISEQIVGSDFLDVWPERIAVKSVRDAFNRYCKERNIHSRTGNHSYISNQILKICPGISTTRKNSDSREYVFPPLPEARKHFEKFIGHEYPWPKNESDLPDDFI